MTVCRDANISLSVGPPLSAVEWIAMKFSTNIHGPRTMNPNDFGDPLTLPRHQQADSFSFESNVSTIIVWITMKFGADIQGPQRIPDDFALTFHPVSPAGEIF